MTRSLTILAGCAPCQPFRPGAPAVRADGQATVVSGVAVPSLRALRPKRRCAGRHQRWENADRVAGHEQVFQRFPADTLERLGMRVCVRRQSTAPLATAFPQNAAADGSAGPKLPASIPEMIAADPREARKTVRQAITAHCGLAQCRRVRPKRQPRVTSTLSENESPADQGLRTRWHVARFRAWAPDRWSAIAPRVDAPHPGVYRDRMSGMRPALRTMIVDPVLRVWQRSLLATLEQDRAISAAGSQAILRKLPALTTHAFIPPTAR